MLIADVLYVMLAAVGRIHFYLIAAKDRQCLLFAFESEVAKIPYATLSYCARPPNRTEFSSFRKIFRDTGFIFFHK
jgi:hypothetical protein